MSLATTPCQQIEPLLSAYLDDELPQQQQQLVRVHLQQCARCQQLADELQSLRGDVQAAHQITLNEDRVMKILNDKPNQWGIRIGFMLLLVTALLIGAFTGYHFFLDLWFDTDAPVWLRLATAGFVLGWVVLFLVVLRQQWLARKTDKYRDVQI